MECVDENDGDTRCPLGVATRSADWRCGSVSPVNLPHTKQEGIKSSSTEPLLSSPRVEPSRDRNARYAEFICQVSDLHLQFMYLSCSHSVCFSGSHLSVCQNG